MMTKKMRAVPKTISLPQSVLEKALERQKAFQYKKFSDYVHALIIADLNSGTNHIRKPRFNVPPGQ